MNIMRRISSFMALALALGLTGSAALADTLLMDSVASSAGTARPHRGMTMDSVLRNYGEPQGRSGPVGQPPITTWDYGNFVVYFENQYVIHAVVPHKK
jgi:hypothetical protein